MPGSRPYYHNHHMPDSIHMNNPFSEISTAASRRTVRKGPLCVAALLLVVVPLVVLSTTKTYFDRSDRVKSRDGGGGGARTPAIPFLKASEKYPAKLRWQSSQTLAKKILGETRFASCEVHSVMMNDKTIVNDWIFMEERDAINVAVYSHDKTFLVFWQQKYAIPGLTHSPVGGYVEVDESPWMAAQREVREELGVGSRVSLQHQQDQLRDEQPVEYDEFGVKTGTVPPSQKEDWIFLGRYRPMANRGGGFHYSYLLKYAVPVAEKGGTVEFQSKGDAEKQELKFLTKEQVYDALESGRDFQEIKWAATMSLALSYLDRHKEE